MADDKKNNRDIINRLRAVSDRPITEVTGDNAKSLLIGVEDIEREIVAVEREIKKRVGDLGDGIEVILKQSNHIKKERRNIKKLADRGKYEQIEQKAEALAAFIVFTRDNYIKLLEAIEKGGEEGKKDLEDIFEKLSVGAPAPVEVPALAQPKKVEGEKKDEDVELVEMFKGEQVPVFAKLADGKFLKVEITGINGKSVSMRTVPSGGEPAKTLTATAAEFVKWQEDYAPDIKNDVGVDKEDGQSPPSEPEPTPEPSVEAESSGEFMYAGHKMVSGAMLTLQMGRAKAPFFVEPGSSADKLILLYRNSAKGDKRYVFEGGKIKDGDAEAKILSVRMPKTTNEKGEEVDIRIPSVRFDRGDLNYEDVLGLELGEEFKLGNKDLHVGDDLYRVVGSEVHVYRIMNNHAEFPLKKDSKEGKRGEMIKRDAIVLRNLSLVEGDRGNGTGETKKEVTFRSKQWERNGSEFFATPEEAQAALESQNARSRSKRPGNKKPDAASAPQPKAASQPKVDSAPPSPARPPQQKVDIPSVPVVDAPPKAIDNAPAADTRDSKDNFGFKHSPKKGDRFLVKRSGGTRAVFDNLDINFSGGKVLIEVLDDPNSFGLKVRALSVHKDELQVGEKHTYQAEVWNALFNFADDVEKLGSGQSVEDALNSKRNDQVTQFFSDRDRNYDDDGEATWNDYEGLDGSGGHTFRQIIKAFGVESTNIIKIVGLDDNGNLVYTVEVEGSNLPRQVKTDKEGWKKLKEAGLERISGDKVMQSSRTQDDEPEPVVPVVQPTVPRPVARPVSTPPARPVPVSRTVATAVPVATPVAIPVATPVAIPVATPVDRPVPVSTTPGGEPKPIPSPSLPDREPQPPQKVEYDSTGAEFETPKGPFNDGDEALFKWGTQDVPVVLLIPQEGSGAPEGTVLVRGVYDKKIQFYLPPESKSWDKITRIPGDTRIKAEELVPPVELPVPPQGDAGNGGGGETPPGGGGEGEPPGGGEGGGDEPPEDDEIDFLDGDDYEWIDDDFEEEQVPVRERPVPPPIPEASELELITLANKIEEIAADSEDSSRFIDPRDLTPGAIGKFLETMNAAAKSKLAKAIEKSIERMTLASNNPAATFAELQRSWRIHQGVPSVLLNDVARRVAEHVNRIREQARAEQEAADAEAARPAIERYMETVSAEKLVEVLSSPERSKVEALFANLTPEMIGADPDNFNEIRETMVGQLYAIAVRFEQEARNRAASRDSEFSSAKDKIDERRKRFWGPEKEKAKKKGEKSKGGRFSSRKVKRMLLAAGLGGAVALGVGTGGLGFGAIGAVASGAFSGVFAGRRMLREEIGEDEMMLAEIRGGVDALPLSTKEKKLGAEKLRVAMAGLLENDFDADSNVREAILQKMIEGRKDQMEASAEVSAEVYELMLERLQVRRDGQNERLLQNPDLQAAIDRVAERSSVLGNIKNWCGDVVKGVFSKGAVASESNIYANSEQKSYARKLGEDLGAGAIAAIIGATIGYGGGTGTERAIMRGGSAAARGAGDVLLHRKDTQASRQDMALQELSLAINDINKRVEGKENAKISPEEKKKIAKLVFKAQEELGRELPDDMVAMVIKRALGHAAVAVGAGATFDWLRGSVGDWFRDNFGDGVDAPRPAASSRESTPSKPIPSVANETPAKPEDLEFEPIEVGGEKSLMKVELGKGDGFLNAFNEAQRDPEFRQDLLESIRKNHTDWVDRANSYGYEEKRMDNYLIRRWRVEQLEKNGFGVKFGSKEWSYDKTPHEGAKVEFFRNKDGYIEARPVLGDGDNISEHGTKTMPVGESKIQNVEKPDAPENVVPARERIPAPPNATRLNGQAKLSILEMNPKASEVIGDVLGPNQKDVRIVGNDIFVIGEDGNIDTVVEYDKLVNPDAARANAADKIVSRGAGSAEQRSQLPAASRGTARPDVGGGARAKAEDMFDNLDTGLDDASRISDPRLNPGQRMKALEDFLGQDRSVSQNNIVFRRGGDGSIRVLLNNDGREIPIGQANERNIGAVGQLLEATKTGNQGDIREAVGAIRSGSVEAPITTAEARAMLDRVPEIPRGVSETFSNIRRAQGSIEINGKTIRGPELQQLKARVSELQSDLGNSIGPNPTKTPAKVVSEMTEFVQGI